MRSVPMVVCVLLLFGGCIGNSRSEEPAVSTTSPMRGDLTHLPDGLPLPDATHAPRAVGGMFPTGFDAVEPTIGVDPEGTIWMTANLETETLPGGPTVIASDDFGLSWDVRGPLLPTGTSRHVVTTDPYIHVDPVTGRVWTADLIHNCNALSWSDDGGETWLTNPNGCGPPGILDHQTYVSAEPRTLPTTLYPRLLYICANEITHADCAVSVDGGATFGPQKPVFVPEDPSGICSALTGHLDADPEGRVFLPTTTCPTGGGAPLVFVTEDDGLTWTRRQVTAEPAFFTAAGDHDVAVTAGDDGTVFVNWIDRAGMVRLAYSRDHGATWSAPLNVTAPGVTATAFNQVTAGEAGRVAFVYVGTTAPGGYNDTDGAGGSGVRDAPNTLWNAYIGIVGDVFVDAPIIVTALVNDPATPIAKGECGRTRCAGMTDFVGMATAPDGRPWASLVDTCVGSCDEDVPNVGFAATLLEGPSLRGAARLVPIGAAE